jgi:methylated-DNA-[protein]-cysteine S-methyltransferase
MNFKDLSSKAWTMPSKIGTLHLVATGKALTGLYLSDPKVAKIQSLREKTPQAVILAMACQQLSEYFDKKRQVFDLPLDAAGTDFQKLVWSELSQIPFGTTVSYGEVARRIGKPKAFRAVGSANGKNPIALIVPCHRVIASGGKMGGYSGGLGIKMKLLELEESK